MNMPSGLVFFLDFQYGNTKTPYTTGQSLYGTRNTASQFPFSTPAAVGGLYGGPEVHIVTGKQIGRAHV